MATIEEAVGLVAQQLTRSKHERALVSARINFLKQAQAAVKKAAALRSENGSAAVSVGNDGAEVTSSADEKKFVRSPEARANMAVAQRRRYAKLRKQNGGKNGPSKKKAPAKKKRRLSEAGRKAISDAAKRRWKKYQKAQQ